MWQYWDLLNRFGVPGWHGRESVQSGHFDDDRREYVVTRPDTPLPWMNYLGTEVYFGIISNTAGGCSLHRDARRRRLTRYRHNNVPLDLGRRYLCPRDELDGDYWSPSWQPTRSRLDSYECRHGLSYTCLSAERNGVRAEMPCFGPLGESLEVWRLRLRNDRHEDANFSVFSSVELCLWDAQDDATNFQRNYSVGEVEVDDGVICDRSEYRERRAHFAYFACSKPPAGYDTQHKAFLGPYRGWDSPPAVERGRFFDSIAHGWAPIGCQCSSPKASPTCARRSSGIRTSGKTEYSCRSEDQARLRGQWIRLFRMPSGDQCKWAAGSETAPVRYRPTTLDTQAGGHPGLSDSGEPMCTAGRSKAVRELEVRQCVDELRCLVHGLERLRRVSTPKAGEQ